MEAAKLINHTKDEISFEKILVIGLGQLGLPVAKYVKEKGFDVYGYDNNERAMDNAEKQYGIKKIDNFSDIDVFIVCISTHREDDISSPQIDGLMAITRKIAKEATNGKLVSIESTVPRGTTRKMFEILEHRFHVVHAPHRWYALEEDVHGVNQLRVIGGVCDCCLRTGIRFYDGVEHADEKENLGYYRGDKTYKSLGIPMYSVSTVELAELSKIVENADRYLQIAFAEDLYMFCKANDISFTELRDAVNTKWNVNILEPRDGIGGHCIPKDTRMFLESSEIKSKILISAQEVDKDYRKYIERMLKDVNQINH
ncbi:MAG: NAD(P)-binding domain-containing protein [Nitrososphaeraceae archaeon]|nr:NAD(P)-binding domain-containing protein [Nitrososphaeraceae archaeon]MDW0168701.1 NAD(P)-binding domain-containing protein [Nitrososphaeraceae archaeon]MDW0172086.1 NAD(P)-binding domain-containing protein [Nitrososphaeraceae archaeon]MDW0172649.1 NAD(P)-binding domain-containing protein [Nitrososphaeraceae archaeon]MDW0175078.1 NAD(P)-binding domain-containing protein [Nitrososphaeraceae archaeon]